MSNTNQHVRVRQRLDFAKIQSAIQIPNLIEVQMKSYQRFLQMDLLPSERDDGGLQSVFTSVFPIKDFRDLPQLRRQRGDQPLSDRRRDLSQVRHVQQEYADLLQQVRRSSRHATQVRRKRMSGTRDDLFRAAESHDTTYDLRQRSRYWRENHSRHQGTGSFLRRYSVDDRERHVHHQRHGTRDCQPVAPLARRVFRIGKQSQLLSRQDYSLPRFVGGVRIRHQEHSLRAYRPQTQIPGLDFSARAGNEDQRRHSAHLLPGGADFSARQGHVLERFARTDRSQTDSRNQKPQIG